jgi:hypothetical protein
VSSHPNNRRLPFDFELYDYDFGAMMLLHVRLLLLSLAVAVYNHRTNAGTHIVGLVQFRHLPKHYTQSVGDLVIVELVVANLRYVVGTLPQKDMVELWGA